MVVLGMMTGSRTLAVLAGLVTVNVHATNNNAVFVDHAPALHVTRALSTTTSASACASEEQTCVQDGACLACLTTYSDAYAACYASFSSAGSDFCSLMTDVLCCASDGCFDNDALVALVGACVLPME